jgi:hypothetical protein
MSPSHGERSDCTRDGSLCNRLRYVLLLVTLYKQNRTPGSHRGNDLQWSRKFPSVECSSHHPNEMPTSCHYGVSGPVGWVHPCLGYLSAVGLSQLCPSKISHNELHVSWWEKRERERERTRKRALFLARLLLTQICARVAAPGSSGLFPGLLFTQTAFMSLCGVIQALTWLGKHLGSRRPGCPLPYVGQGRAFVKEWTLRAAESGTGPVHTWSRYLA